MIITKVAEAINGWILEVHLLPSHICGSHVTYYIYTQPNEVLGHLSRLKREYKDGFYQVEGVKNASIL